MSTLRPVLVVVPRPQRRWRSMGLLVVFVTLAHLVLMGLIPRGGERDRLPLAQTFSTRTIVIAPPAATGGGAPGAAAAGTAAASPAAGPTPTAQLRSKPREVPAQPPKLRPKPKPKPTPATEPVPEADTAATPTPDPEPPTMPDTAAAAATPNAQPDASPTPQPSPAPSLDALASGERDRSAQADSGAAGGGGKGTGEGAGEGAGKGAGVPGARYPLKMPGSVRLEYAATGQQGAQPMSGVFAELDWLQNGSEYNARLAMRLLFRTLRSRTSVGRIGPGGVEPERFSDTRRSEVATHFVRDKGQIVFSSNTTPAALQPGAQDELSVVMQLTALIAGDPERHGPGTSFSMQTVGSRNAEVWSFSVDGEETVETPAGTFATRKLTRLPRKEFDRKIELWLAPEMAWLPVRMRQTEPNGDWADMQLRQKVTPSPAS